MKNKYLVHTSHSKKVLKLSDVIIGKNYGNNWYRKEVRFDICSYMYINKIDPINYLNELDKDSLRLVCFYFNVFVMDNLSKNDLIKIATPVIVSKIKLFHTRYLRFKKISENTDELFNLIRGKI